MQILLYKTHYIFAKHDLSTQIFKNEGFFMLNYTKLWFYLSQKGMQRTDLTKNKIISTATLAKLGKNEPVNTTVIEKICDFLDCQPGDIMENVKKEDIIKAGEMINQRLNEFMGALTIATGMSKEMLLDELMKEAPAMLQSMKNGNQDLIGLQNFIEKTDKKEKVIDSTSQSVEHCEKNLP